jgi:hypothetical protein
VCIYVLSRTCTCPVHLLMFLSRHPRVILKYAAPYCVLSPPVTSSIIGPGVLPRTLRHTYYYERLDSSVGIATGCRLDDQGVGVRVPVRSRIFTSSRPVLGPTEPPIQYVPGAISPEREADNSQLVPRSRKRGSIHPLPHPFSWRSA